MRITRQLADECIREVAIHIKEFGFTKTMFTQRIVDLCMQDIGFDKDEVTGMFYVIKRKL